MKLSQELNEALNMQIIHELKNSNIYSQIESFFEDLQLKNLANYFKNNSQHEKEHANKFIEYLNSRTGGKVSIGEIDGVVEINTIEDIANLYVQTEESTTESIEDIYDLVFEQKSYMDLGFIQSMLNEQVEEEDVANEFALKIKMTKDYVLFDATFEGNG